MGNSDLKWYIVNTYSGYEARAKASLEERIKSGPHADKFGEVLLPVETVVETKAGGEKKTSTRKCFPGYILVQMELNNETWHIVKSTPKISGFVGGGKNPPAMKQSEVDKILGRKEESIEVVHSQQTYELGDNVRVLDGPFVNFTGTVDKIDGEKDRLCVLVSIMGRVVPLDLQFNQVEKADAQTK